MTSLHIGWPSRWLVRAAGVAGLAFVGSLWGFPAHGQAQISGDFKSANSAPDWTISPAPKVSTATDGSGWLRLVSVDDRGSAGKVQAKAILPSNSPIRVEFDTVTWGGWRFINDGMAVYFFDPKAHAAGLEGLAGGGMGYCNMKGAYLGIAIDDYGNFSKIGCGYRHGWMPRNGMPASDRGAHSVSIRGPQTSTAATTHMFVKKVPMQGLVDPICYSCKTRDEAISKKAERHVVLTLEPRAPPEVGYLIGMTINGQKIFDKEVFAFAAPAELGVGLVASTGSSSAIQEVRDLKVTVGAEMCFAGVGPDRFGVKLWDTVSAAEAIKPLVGEQTAVVSF